MAQTKAMMYFDSDDLGKVLKDMVITTRELCDLLEISLGGVHYIKTTGRISVAAYRILKKEYKKRTKKDLRLNEDEAIKTAQKLDGRKSNSRKQPKKIDLSKVEYEDLIAEIEKRKKEMKRKLELGKNIQ